MSNRIRCNVSNVCVCAPFTTASEEGVMISLLCFTRCPGSHKELFTTHASNYTLTSFLHVPFLFHWPAPLCSCVLAPSCPVRCSVRRLLCGSWYEAHADCVCLRLRTLCPAPCKRLLSICRVRHMLARASISRLPPPPELQERSTSQNTDKNIEPIKHIQ